uniref:Ig-like domain-containing protein n=1 Tax=Sinocyclocheilus anshuiensis TaxID=1608454 RepID=A0A671R548_9TELE
ILLIANSSNYLIGFVLLNLETTRLSGFEEVICSSRDVYPAPRVNLFTEPASLPDSFQPFTRKTADKQGLYSVESKLKKLKDLTYICLVQSFYRSQTWRASLVEGQDFIIPCVAPWNLQNFTLTWSFIKEHKSSTIYTYDSLTQRSSSVWKKVRLVTPRGRGGDGSLQLHNPLSLEHTGTYTCILSAHQTKHEVHTRVNITQTKHEVHTRWLLIVKGRPMLKIKWKVISRYSGDVEDTGKPCEIGAS